MIRYPQIDPVAFSLGPLQVHWYGLMYLIGFGGAFLLLSKRAGRPGSGWTREQVSDLIFYGAIGAVLGGRLGYVFFYNFDRFLADPAWLLRVWEGGMSFHGGLLGVLLAIGFFGRKYGKSFLDIGDFGAPAVPIGLGAGRLGNFIGAELWGRSSDVSWAMVFPTDPQQLPRHPSQLYQFALEGVVMFLVLWWVSRKPRRRGVVSGLFLVLYGSFRILVEFFREPDAQLGFIALGWVTMGQLLSLPMAALGVVLMVFGWRPGSATGKTPGP